MMNSAGIELEARRNTAMHFFRYSNDISNLPLFVSNLGTVIKTWNTVLVYIIDPSS